MSQEVNTTQTDPLVVLGSLGVVSTPICASAAILVFAHGLHRKRVYRLALYQVLGSLMHSVLLALQLVFLKYGNGPLCQSMAYLFNSSHWFKLLVLTWLTFHLFFVAVCYCDKNSRKLEITLVVLLVITSLAMSAVPFATQSYGQTPQLWCWMLNNGTDINRDDVVKFITWLLPTTALLVISIVLVTVIVSVLVTRNCRELESGKIVAIGARKRALKQMCPLMAYPVAYVVLLVFPLTFAIVGDVNSKSSALIPLTYLTAISIPMWSLSYGVTLLVVVLRYRCERARKWKAGPLPHDVYGTLDLNPPTTLAQP